MKQIKWGNTQKLIPAIALGCMRMSELSLEETTRLLDTALQEGVNFFDHADIYGRGACEVKFGDALKEMATGREELFIQSKCGIVPGVMFDFSKEHILQAVDGSLKRLGIEYLDALLLHRPDALVELEEVAAAFDELEQAGKVRYFGVSNQKPLQMELLKKYVRQPLCVNQLQFGLAHTGMVSNGIEVNMLTEGAADRDGSVLDYCRLHDVTIQAWSPFQSSAFGGVFWENENYSELNQKLNELAHKYSVTVTTIATAWVLRHPAHMQVLAGTMKPGRLKEICQAVEICLTREEWYALYKAAGNILP